MASGTATRAFLPRQTDRESTKFPGGPAACLRACPAVNPWPAVRNDRKNRDGPEAVTSRLPGFHALSLAERLRRVARMCDLSPAEVRSLRGGAAREPDIADRMIENAIGTFALPLGLGLNVVVNGHDYLVPMAVEEPSVVAAQSLA